MRWPEIVSEIEQTKTENKSRLAQMVHTSILERLENISPYVIWSMSEKTLRDIEIDLKTALLNNYGCKLRTSTCLVMDSIPDADIN